MRRLADGVKEVEGVITAIGHVFGALLAELPEPRKSILRANILSWLVSYLPEGVDETEDFELTKERLDEFTKQVDPGTKGRIEFYAMVLGLASHFEEDCPPYLKIKEAALARPEDRPALSAPDEDE